MINMLNIIVPLIVLIFLITLLIRFKKYRKLYIIDYVLIICILLLGTYSIIQMISNFSIKSIMKEKLNVITQTVEHNKIDSLKTDIEKLEIFVNTIEKLDLSDTPDDFRIAFKHYSKEFRKTLVMSKEKGEIFMGNNEHIASAKDSLISIYSKY